MNEKLIVMHKKRMKERFKKNVALHKDCGQTHKTILVETKTKTTLKVVYYAK